MSTKEYKCVKKTKKSFETALVELAMDMPMNKISVKQICEYAELSRNAFYFHYEDINSLVKEVEDTMIEEITSIFLDIRETPFPDNVLEVIQRLTDYFIEHRETTLMLTDSSYSTSFTKRIDIAFSAFYYEYYKSYNPNLTKASFDLFYGFISNGYTGMLMGWLRNPEGISKRHFVRLAFIFTSALIKK